MSDLLYRKELLRLAADANGAGRLHAHNASGQAFNSTCGDHVSVQLLLADGRVCEFAHETKACLLAQASASILGITLRNASVPDIEQLRSNVSAMLKLKSAPPTAPFAEYSAFEGAAEYQNRHRCVLLPINAVLNALLLQEPGRVRLDS